MLLLLPLVFAACGDDGAAGEGPAIVATTTQLGDMARNLAPAATVTTLLHANTDPHEYEVRPHDVKALAGADIVLRSGGEVDEWLEGALDSAGVDEQDVGPESHRFERARAEALDENGSVLHETQ